MLLVQTLAQGLGLTDCDPAADSLNLVNCLRLKDGQTVGAVYTDPAFLVNLIVRNLFVIAGIIFFVMILIAGFQIITNPKGLDAARDMLGAAMIGLLLMFAAYWILQIIKIVTGANVGI